MTLPTDRPRPMMEPGGTVNGARASVWARARRATVNLVRGRGVAATQAFAPLLDAKAAAQLLGVPHTWLLAQARAGRIPHHRLGHYVRFSAEDLRAWLVDNRVEPDPLADRRRPSQP
jgi:excisionase family DNA binding protein